MLFKEHAYFDSPVFPSSSAKYGSLRSTSDGISSSLTSFSAVACNKAETLFQPTYKLQVSLELNVPSVRNYECENQSITCGTITKLEPTRNC